MCSMVWSEYNRINSTEYLASGVDNVSEHRLMSQVVKVREIVWFYIQSDGGDSIPVFT